MHPSHKQVLDVADVMGLSTWSQDANAEHIMGLCVVELLVYGLILDTNDVNCCQDCFMVFFGDSQVFQVDVAKTLSFR